MLDAARRLQAVRPASEIEQLELLRRRFLVFRALNVNSPDPIPLPHEVLGQVMSNEPTGAGH